MRRIKANIWLLIITIGLFSLSLTPVLAQQMLVQVVGGGFRFDGPSAITFASVTAQFSDQSGTVAVRNLSPAYIEIEDQNGGSTFDVQLSATGALAKTSDPTQTISLANLKARNIDDGSPTLTTVNGRTDGFTLNSSLNSLTSLSSAVTLGSGSGNQPGKWRFFPEFELTVPSGTTLGTYETTLVFTII